jgi:hypothetical protein
VIMDISGLRFRHVLVNNGQKNSTPMKHSHH